MTDSAQTPSFDPAVTDTPLTSGSYVNDYAPPSDQVQTQQPPVVAQNAYDETPPTQPVIDSPVDSPVMPATPAAPAAPLTEDTTVSAGSTPVSSGTNSEALEDQNIFELLGVMDGSETEKEEFLDELQQVIWEDFLENDVALLVTQEEYAEVQQMMNDESLEEVAKQEKMIVYLEKRIPDLEEIMLEKALELKEDMVRERIAGMREYYNGQTAVMSTLDQAETLVNQSHWASAARVLNEIS